MADGIPTLDFRAMGAQTGLAEGFAEAALSLEQTTELRRHQRIQQQMHVQQLALGVQGLVQKYKELDDRWQMAREELSGLDRRQLRDISSRRALERMRHIYELDIQDDAQEHLVGIEMLREGHDARMKEVEKDIAKITREPSMIAAIVGRERWEAEQIVAVSDSVNTFARSNVFSELGDGGSDVFDKDRLRKLSEESGVSPDIILRPMYTDWLAAAEQQEQFDEFNLNRIMPFEGFKAHILSIATGRTDFRDYALERSRIEQQSARDIHIADMSEQLAATVAMGSSLLGIDYDKTAGKLTLSPTKIVDTGEGAVPADNLLIDARIRSVVDGKLTGDRAEAHYIAIASELGLMDQSSRRDLYQHLDLYIYRNHGHVASVSGMPPEVLPVASELIDRNFGADVGSGDALSRRAEGQREGAERGRASATLAERAARAARLADPAALEDVAGDISSELDRVEEKIRSQEGVEGPGNAGVPLYRQRDDLMALARDVMFAMAGKMTTPEPTPDPLAPDLLRAQAERMGIGVSEPATPSPAQPESTE